MTIARGTRGRFAVGACSRCALRTIALPPEFADLSVEQSRDEYVASYCGRLDATIAHRVAAVRAAHAPPAAVLDFGASFGFILDALQAAGYQTAAFEKSPAALAELRGRGVHAVYGELDELPENAFDVVTLWHVLEHLADPLAVVARLRRSLRPGGTMLVAVPNAEGLFSRLAFDHWIWTMPWHLHYFTRAALRRFAERAQLTISGPLRTGSGDIAALETLLAGVAGRTPSRLTAALYERAPAARAAASPAIDRLRRIVRPAGLALQKLAALAGYGEELVLAARREA